MTNVAGHLREQNGMYQMILSWKAQNQIHQHRTSG